MQVIGQAEARTGEYAFLRVLEVLRQVVTGDAKRGHRRISRQDARERSVEETAMLQVFVILLAFLMRAPVRGTEGQLVLATEQAERALHLGLAQQLVGLAAGVVGIRVGNITGDATDIKHVGVLLFLLPGGRERGVPVIAEIMLKLDEGPLGVQVPVGPRLADAVAAPAVVDGIAVVVHQWQVAPGAAVGITVVLGEAHSHGVGVGHIERQQAGSNVALVAVAVHP